MEKASIKKVSWKIIRKKVAQVNPEFAHIVDNIDPDDRLELYVARYPYGSIIVNEGIFYLPTPQGDVVSVEDPRIDLTIKNDFNYSGTGTGLPAGMVLDHTMHESVVTAADQILPLGVVYPGSIFALWKKLDTNPSFHPVKMFTITAGARFIFFLPNISDLAFHKNLKKDFNVRQPPPKHLLDQWEIFKTIIWHPDTRCNWSTEILFFPKQWFEKIKNDTAWRSLYLFMLERVWKKSAYERNQMFYDLIVSCAQTHRNLKPNPYLADTVKHLLSVASGTVVGFGPAENDSCAPIELLQDVYVNSYRLKQYIPTMFVPTHFSLFGSGTPVYYSLNFPTTLEFSPKSRKVASTIHNLSELQYVTRIFIDEVLNGKLRKRIQETIIEKIVENIEFNFFHSKLDRYGEISSTDEMLQGDPLLSFCSAKYRNREFATTGAFVRGCVRISKK